METNKPKNVNQYHLYNSVAMEIENIFNPLIEQLIARKGVLMTKLQTMKEDFLTKEASREAAIEELDRMIQRMQEESIKMNMNLEIQEKAIQMYREEMNQHQAPTKPQPFFSCPTLYHLQTQIAEFGEVRDRELDYSLQKQPVLAVGKKSNYELDIPKRKSTMTASSEYFSMVVSSSNKREIVRTKREIPIMEALEPVLKNWGYREMSNVIAQIRYYEFELKPERLAGDIAGMEVFIKSDDSVDEVLRGFYPFISKASLNAFTRDFLNCDGWYLVRESSSDDGQLSLAVTFAKQLRHFKISFNPTDASYQIAYKKSFDTLHQLIDHYKNNPLMRTQDGDILLLNPIPKLDEKHVSVVKNSSNLPSKLVANLASLSDIRATSPVLLHPHTHPSGPTPLSSNNDNPSTVTIYHTASQNIPAPWVQVYSKSQGKCYYFNPSTDAISWEFPNPTSLVKKPTTRPAF